MSPLWIIVAEFVGLIVLLIGGDLAVTSGRSTMRTIDRVDRLTFGYFMVMFATFGVILLAKAFAAD